MILRYPINDQLYNLSLIPNITETLDISDSNTIMISQHQYRFRYFKCWYLHKAVAIIDCSGSAMSFI